MKKTRETKQQKRCEKNQPFFFLRHLSSHESCVFEVFRLVPFSATFGVDEVEKDGILAEEISLGRRSNGKRSVFE